MLLKKCLVCNCEFEKKYNISQLEWRKQKYCSRPCYYQSKHGHTPWNKGIKGVMIPWNKGLKGVQVAWNKGLPSPKGDENPSWKGDDAKYSAKHKWIESVKGKPETCEFCGKSGLTRQKIHWANKDHEYKRILDDWLRLCAKC